MSGRYLATIPCSSSATFGADRRRCVKPKTEWLHQVQVYGQPRAVMSETEPMPWWSRHTRT